MALKPFNYRSETLLLHRFFVFSIQSTCLIWLCSNLYSNYSSLYRTVFVITQCRCISRNRWEVWRLRWINLSLARLLEQLHSCSEVKMIGLDTIALCRISCLNLYFKGGLELGCWCFVAYLIKFVHQQQVIFTYNDFLLGHWRCFTWSVNGMWAAFLLKLGVQKHNSSWALCWCTAHTYTLCCE